MTRTAEAGSVVTVQNKDGVTHSVTADGGAFDVAVPAGTTARFVAPSRPGTYAFHCNFHASMHGTLTVASPWRHRGVTVTRRDAT